MNPSNKYAWTYDHTENVGYLRLTLDTDVDRTIPLTTELNLDLAKDGTPIGVEYIGVTKSEVSNDSKELRYQIEEVHGVIIGNE